MDMYVKHPHLLEFNPRSGPTALSTTASVLHYHHSSEDTVIIMFFLSQKDFKYVNLYKMSDDVLNSKHH